MLQKDHLKLKIKQKNKLLNKYHQIYLMFNYIHHKIKIKDKILMNKINNNNLNNNKIHNKEIKNKCYLYYNLKDIQNNLMKHQKHQKYYNMVLLYLLYMD